VPGDTRIAYDAGPQARQILNDAEDDLRDWQPEPDGSIVSAQQNTSPPLSAKGKEPAPLDDATSVGTDLRTDASTEPVGSESVPSTAQPTM
jgi:hypothetical protein